MYMCILFDILQDFSAYFGDLFGDVNLHKTAWD